jgi:MFS superfamily sulfate permease-like transporter
MERVDRSFGRALFMIPIAALTGDMLMVCAAIVDWKFLRNIPKLPVQETVAMRALGQARNGTAL